MTRALVEFVTPWLVDHPEDVTITEVEGEREGVVVEISVNPEDTGKIIGKRGRIIHSLRALARAAGQKNGEPVSVEVVD